jgi:hypothetical protein
MRQPLHIIAPDGPHAIVLLQEALLDGPPKVDHMIRFSYLRESNTAKETREFIQQIPDALDDSIKKQWGRPTTVSGKVRVGVYCLDLSNAGDRNVANMMKLHNGSVEHESDLLRQQTISKILNEQHEPTICTAYKLPIPHQFLPSWSAKRVDPHQLLSVGWGHGKSIQEG